MRKQLNLLLILLLTAFSFLDPAWAADEPAPPAASAPTTPAPVESKKAQLPQGTLYRVSYQGHTAYLFGTIHVGKPEFYPLEPQVTQALKDAEVLAVEFDITDTAAVQQAAFKYALYPNFGSVESHLSANTIVELKKSLTVLGLPYEGLSHMKPWMIGNVMLLSSLEKQGYPANLATDTYLIKAAKDQGKSIVGLESADFQLGLFDKLSEKQQEAYLNDCMHDLASGEIAKKNQELLDAWEHADHATFDKLLAEARTDKTMSGRFFYKELLQRRNPLMADKVAQLVKDHEHSFVGVGLLHLVGPEGLPQVLQKKGFEVQQIY